MFASQVFAGTKLHQLMSLHTGKVGNLCSGLRPKIGLQIKLWLISVFGLSARLHQKVKWPIVLFDVHVP